jgi:Spy/CpxP family protein refolding chaperone
MPRGAAAKVMFLAVSSPDRRWFMVRHSTMAALVALLAAGAPAQAEDPDEMANCPMGMMGAGMGRGMMGDGMPGGMGMMGGMHGAPLHRLDLTPEQRTKINKIHDELRRKNWEALGKVQDEEAKLRDLYAADKRDPKAIGAVYGSIYALKRQMIEAGIDAHNRMEALLSDAQRAQLKQMGSGMGPGARGMMNR